MPFAAVFFLARQAGGDSSCGGMSARSPELPRLAELDGVRGCAIALVLLWHYAAEQIHAPLQSAAGRVAQVLGLCWSGVDLFFVLSGFLIAGILLPDQGRIVFADGVDLVRLPEAQRDVYRGRNIGYVFQRHHLLPGFTALENVLLGMGFSARRPDPAWARHLLEQVGLGERLHHRPRQLSVGQQQRVACARALANRPPLVLADEPTGALDEANANQVLELIGGLCRELKASLLIATHDARVVAALPRTVALAGLNRQPA